MSRISRKIWIAILVVLAAASAAIIVIAASASHDRKIEKSMQAPYLISLKCRTDKAGANEISFSSKNGHRYEILRKVTGAKADGKDHGYAAIGVVKADGQSASFKDKRAVYGNEYTYSVREVAKSSSGRHDVAGAFDEVGMATLAEPELDIKLTNLNAEIEWEPVPGATSYEIYRRSSETGYFKKLAQLEADTETEFRYIDNYAESLSTPFEKQILYKDAYVDPSNNPLTYKVVAIRNDSGEDVVGYSSANGCTRLSQPDMLGVRAGGSSASVWFSGVPNASGYTIYAGKSSAQGTDWQAAATVRDRGARVNAVQIRVPEGCDRFTAAAFNDTDPSNIISGPHSSGISIKGRRYGNVNVLFAGDSIVFGTPYSHWYGNLFSFPHRCSELLGIKYANLGVGGATVADSKAESHIAIGQIEVVGEGRSSRYNGDLSDFDVVVLEGGANDYSRSIPLGSADSYDTSTYCGALNYCMSFIEKASHKRQEEGKSPTKVIFMDIPYSARDKDDPIVPVSRDTLKNKKGLTYIDYRRAMRNVISRYENTNTMSVYRFDSTAYNILDSSNVAVSSVDNLHMTSNVYGRLGDVFARYLETRVLS